MKWRIVLDTNCLLASLSKRGMYHDVWTGLLNGEYELCVSNEILEEYEEIISQKTNALIASNVIQTLLNCPFVLCFDPHFKFRMVEADWDDNKFTDCAIIANAHYIVSNDNHLLSIPQPSFPPISVKTISEFLSMLKRATSEPTI